MEVYAVAKEDAPLEPSPLLPMRPPGLIQREQDDLVMVPMTAGGGSHCLGTPNRRDADTA